MAVTNGYADGDDVQALINRLGGATLTLSGGSTPTLAQAEGWLDQVAAEIDGVLKSQGYSTVPATGTSDVLMIGRHVAQKAAAIVYHAWAMYDETPDKIGQWEEEYQQFLDRLLDKKIRLVDQSPRGKIGSVTPRRYIEG